MNDTRKASLTIGAIMLIQLFAGPTINFVLMGPVQAAPGFLVNASAHATAAASAVLLALAMALCSLLVSVAFWQVVRPCSLPMALLVLALGIANFSTEVTEQTATMSMLTLSQKFATATAADAGLFQGLAVLVGAAHRWAHYMNLIVGSFSMSVFYLALLRFALIPRALAGFGLVAALLLLYAVATPLLGQKINFTLMAPVGLAQLAVAFWLLARGFAEPRLQAPTAIT